MGAQGTWLAGQAKALAPVGYHSSTRHPMIAPCRCRSKPRAGMHLEHLQDDLHASLHEA